MMATRYGMKLSFHMSRKSATTIRGRRQLGAASAENENSDHRVPRYRDCIDQQATAVGFRDGGRDSRAWPP